MNEVCKKKRKIKMEDKQEFKKKMLIRKKHNETKKEFRKKLHIKGYKNKNIIL